MTASIDIVRAMNRVLRVLMQERIAQGLTVTDIAGRIGVTRQAVEAWESGTNKPTLLSLFTYAHHVNVDILGIARRVAPRTAEVANG